MTSSIAVDIDPDLTHELRIIAAQSACTKANNEGDLIAAGRHWREFVRLIAERSPRQVERMEWERGLI